MDVLWKQTSVPSFTSWTQLLYQKVSESQTQISYRRQESKDANTAAWYCLSKLFPFLPPKKKRLVEKDEGGKWVIWVTCFRRLMSRLFPSEDNLPVHLCFARSFLKTRRGGTLPVLSRRLCAQLKRQMEGRSYRRRAKDARIFTSTANGEHLGGLNRASCVSAGVQYYHSELYP